MRVIKHDPFSRETLLRENVYTKETCSLCGNQKRTTTGKPYLYRYLMEPDSLTGKQYPVRGLFCSKSCMESYQ